MKKDQFLDAVKQEATALRLNATYDEKSRLNFDNLEPDSPSSCIYGQMTGNCINHRALQLMNLCCTVGVAVMGVSYELQNTLNKSIIFYKKTKNFASKREGWDFMTPIEQYICFTDAKNSELIEYIKGETDKLEL